jgi:hypothetical protein
MFVSTLILAGNGFFSCASQHRDSSEQLVKQTSELSRTLTTYTDNGLQAVNAVGCHGRTLRRMFFQRPGTLYQTPEALIVHLDPFGGQEALVPVVDEFNAAGHRLSWLENRQVVLSLTPPAPARAGP